MSGVRSMPFRWWLALALASLLMVACSTDGGDDPAEASPHEERAPVLAEEFDYEGYLETLQQASRIENPPETEIVRVLAPEEQGEVWQDCMREAGYEVSVTSDGGLVPASNLPVDQRDAYELADYTCHAQYPVDESLYPQFGDAQVEVLYRYYVDEQLPCLEDEGLEVGEPPTFETFRESWVSSGSGLHATEGTWHPYGVIDLALLSDDEWEALNVACPQSPSNDVLFGSDN
jgi:hypothetical protein